MNALGDPERLRCLSCGAQRLKCDGSHPACGRCQQERRACSYDWTVPGVFSLFPSGANLNDKISLHIGAYHANEGGFGRVYRTQTTTGELVAVKVFFENRWVYGRALELSVREAWTWQHLDHPNIIPFLGIADYMTVCPGALPQLCLVSPWMEAGNVMEYIALHPVANRLPFLLDVVNGVEYLHTFPSGPIIHGDLKGNNILVDTGGKRPVARICDFGLAQVLESTMKDGLSTTSTAFGGNARWMAPERLDPKRYGLGQLESKSTKSDVFEMMRTFLQILTGKPPFFDTSDLAAAVAAMQGLFPEYPSAYCHGLDNDRVNLMRQAWSTSREERPSLTDIRRDLEQSWFLDDFLDLPSPFLNLEPILERWISFSRVAHEKARLRPTLVIWPHTLRMLYNLWPASALHDIGIKAIRLPIRYGAWETGELKEVLAGTPSLSRLEIHASSDSGLLSLNSYHIIPVFQFARRFTPNLATLVVKGIPMSIGRLSAWSLRNLEIEIGPDVHLSSPWRFADWCEVLDNSPALERLVIEDMGEIEETWRETYSALAGGRRISTVLRGRRTKLITPPALRVLRLKTGTLYMAVTFMTLLSATDLSDMSLWIPRNGEIVSTRDSGCHVLQVVANYWPKLAVLRLLGETDALHRYSNGLLKPFSCLEVLEWNDADWLEIMLSNGFIDQVQPVPKLKTLRLRGGHPFRTRYGVEVAHLNDSVLNLIRKRASAGFPLQRVLIDQDHVDEIITMCPALLSARVELGWFKPCDSLEGFKEDLEPEWGLFSEEKRLIWPGYTQAS